MGQATALYINDYDTSRLGLLVRRADGRRGGLMVKDRVTTLPKRAGEVPMAREAEVTPRTIVCTGQIDLRRQTAAAIPGVLDEIKARCYAGPVELRFADDPERMYVVLAEDIEIRGTDPDFANPVSDITMTFRAMDPIGYKKAGDVIGFRTLATPVPLGSAISLPVVRLAGAVTNPVVTYRDARGVQQGQIGVTVTLGATEFLDLDCELCKIWRWTAGVRASGEALVMSGDFLRLDPEHGDRANGVWPTLEVSPDCAGEVLYRKAYL